MTSIAELYALQEIDLALAAARASFEDVSSRIGEPDELAEVRNAVAEREEALEAAEKHARALEDEAEDHQAKVGPIETKLFDGKVTNPKELEDLQLDLDSLKRRRGELDDQALAAMEHMEQAQRELSETESALKELTGDVTSENEDLARQQIQLQREIARLEVQRAEEAEGNDAEMMRLYDTLAATRQNRPVAKVVGGACQGCRISLPANVLQRVRAAGQVVQCTNCERILYVT